MSLVCYDYSDSSEPESENEDDVQIKTLPNRDVQETLEGNESNSIVNPLFASLPKPKQVTTNTIVEELEDDILVKNKVEQTMEKKKPNKVKITIPALSGYKSDDEDSSPKKIINTAPQKPSGLFAILPTPKRIPVETKPKFDAAVIKQKNLMPRHIQTNQKIKSAKREIDSDDEDIAEGQNFFSSIFADSKVNSAPAVSSPSFTLNMQIDSAKAVTNTKTNDYFSNLVATAAKQPGLEENLDDLQKDALKQLCGKQHKRMKGDDIKIIDVNAADALLDPQEWRVKALTEEAPTPACKKGEEPSVQSRRKHQITYLAYQAKMNEQDLKNQWALNRMTRKQTQAKYGF